MPLLGFEVRNTYVDAVNPDGAITSQFSVSNDTDIEIFMQLEVRQADCGNYMAVSGNAGMNERSHSVQTPYPQTGTSEQQCDQDSITQQEYVFRCLDL